MKHVAVVALVLSLGQSPVALAGGPLLESALRKARQLVHTPTESPEAAEARRVAADLGVGRDVVVDLTSGTTVRGRLLAVTYDHFVLRAGDPATSIEIAYDDVETLEPNVDIVPKVWMWVGAGVAAAVIVSVVAFYKRSDSDVRPGGGAGTFPVTFSTDGSEF